MAKADSIQNGIKTETTDDVEKSLELLDKVLSEFEEEQEIAHAPVEPDSPSQGHQSEDDGYMSMNGRRAKFVPDFQPTDEANVPLLPLPVPPDGKYSPPSPEEAERIISNLLPRISPTTSPSHRTNSTSSSSNNRSPAHSTNSSHYHHHHHHSSGHSEWRTRNLIRHSDSINSSTSDKPSSNDVTVIAKNPTQTTLPKTRPPHVLPTRYASLPCSSPPKQAGPSEPSGGSLDEGRNKLGGIGISAVHDAVLRGMTRMPEPIVNEHPVTIYPGRASPPRRHPGRNFSNSIERHRDVCRKGNYTPDNSSSQENSSPENNESENNSLSPTHGVQININYNNNLVSNRIFASSMEYTRQVRQRTQTDSDDERFSEDSLEESSLPPPPGPVTVPPPPSLSAPVTPSKRHSIAWEVNLDDPASFGDPLTIPKGTVSGSTKVVGRRKGKNVNDSQSSLESTPSNKKSESSEWPDPPDIPICSTEDEAASLYSDSDELIPQVPDINGRGTYVIRKGRRRQRLESLDSNASNNLPIPGNELQPITTLPSPVFPVSMMLPKSRHSIDLGLSSTYNGGAIKPSHSAPQQLPNSVLSPRSRLSLDLSSPTSELSTNARKISTPTGNIPSHLHQHLQSSQIHSNNNNNNNNNSSLSKNKPNQSSSNNNNLNTTCANNNNSITVGSGCLVGSVLVGNGSSTLNQLPPVVSSRYTEFKTYSSTFDGLQALENSNSSCNNNNNNNSINRGGAIGNGSTVVSVSDNDNPLMRVSSLPAVTSPHPSTATAEGLSTPRRELAPPIEEDEEVDSDTQRGVPLRKIEDNISALLRGDISVARVADIPPARRPLGFRLGVHKSESAKEMLLSQAGLGPLPPSPPSSSPDQDSDEFPPLPPSPLEEPEVIHQMHGICITSRNRSSSIKHDGHYREDHPPAVPPHRGPSINTLKTRSMDAGFSKSYRSGSHTSTSPHAPGTLPPDLPGCNSRRRIITGGYQKRTAQSPREERCLQTSCSLPETPIFARGCDIPRTPHRRAPEVPPHGSGSRTAPRTNTNTTSSLGSSVVGIGTSTIGGRQRSISQAFANGEMLRLAGGPARGWYPKQRQARPASTEQLDRLHPQGSLRAWEAGTGSRKPLTLPPNLTPKFFNKSPREALRRVTSLLIRKGNSGTKEKESRKEKDRSERDGYSSSSVFLQRSPGSDVTDSRNYPHHNHHQQQQQQQHSSQHTTPTTQKKKGFFKSFWKKSRHYSLEKQ
ncbi:rho GTPase-activating protein gacU isoform X2 [Malaya genurostris]|uniref:rho GTPase-activating protein gacU isoform X2 n=1 Tax=Malaya genurostris TaxID=325434 RepID=UPI0026F3AAFC|nr:rho GTPase-activating protein gacU isoform X2 [Malaya genurostris]